MSKNFRPDDVGARQRFVHWTNTALGLVVFVAIGTPGALAYFLGLLVLHARADRVRGYSMMDRLLLAHEDDLARARKAFLGAAPRKTLSLAGRRPHRVSAALSVLALLASAVLLGERVSDAPAAAGVVARLGIALAASVALWAALFGVSRRTRLVFGTDGLRVRSTFIRYADVTGLARDGSSVTLQRRASLPPVVVRTSDPETAEWLTAVLEAERGRGRERRAEPSPPLPPEGFREHASNVGWRVRVLDAASDEERNAVIARVSTDDLEALLEETADPSLEDALRARLRR